MSDLNVNHEPFLSLHVLPFKNTIWTISIYLLHASMTKYIFCYVSGRAVRKALSNKIKGRGMQSVSGIYSHLQTRTATNIYV